MSIDKTVTKSEKKEFDKELLQAKVLAKKNFESEPADPIRDLNISGAPGGSHGIFNYMELQTRIVENYKSVFLQKGKQFTQSYIASSDKIRNIFSKKYKAAKKALKEM